METLQENTRFYEEVLQYPFIMAVSDFSRYYGMGATKFNKILKEVGIQYKQGNLWILSAKYQDNGYTRTREVAYKKPDGTKVLRHQMRWTQEGRKFLYRTLKEKEILPIRKK